MRAVTGHSRLPILAIAAILIAGCGATAPSSGPTALTAPESLSAHTTPPPATPPATLPDPTPTTNSSCPGLQPDMGIPSADFDVWTPIGGFFLGLDVTRVSPNSDPGQAILLEGGKPYLDDPIRLVGGWQIGLDPGIDYDESGEVSITLLGAIATVHVDGRRPIRMNGVVGTLPKTKRPGFLFDVPDVKAAVIDFTVEWSDTCFTYVAEKAWGVQMVRAAFADRCPSDQEEFTTHWAALEEPPIKAGGIPMPLYRSSTLGLWTQYAVSAQGNVGFAHWDPASDAAIGIAGGTVRVGDGNVDLRLASFSTEFFRRGDIVDWIKNDEWPGRELIVFRSTADPYPDGHFEILLPGYPGRYVASFYFQWESPCASGDGVAAVSINVE